MDMDLQSYDKVKQAIERKHYGEARGICDDMLEAMGDNPQVFAMLADLHHRKGEWLEAVGFYDKALAIKQDEGEWWWGLSKSHFYLHDYTACLVCGDIAQKLGAVDVDGLVNMAIAATGISQDDFSQRAEALILKALAYDWTHPRAHMAMGELLLSRREFGPGWREYAWRKKVFAGIDPRPCSGEWAGQRVRNGTLIVMTEGGFGDGIQFSRFIPYVNDLCSDVVIASCPELQGLFQGAFPKNRVISQFQEFPPHAMHVGMIDLPAIFHDKVMIHPTDFRISEQRIQTRRDMFFYNSKNAMKVGLCWRGRSSHRADGRRSMPVGTMLDLLDVPRCEFYSLQLDTTEDEFRALDGAAKPFTGIRGWRDTAEHILNLDLVITVDTAVAHLAASLGKMTWVLLSRPAEWRWGMYGISSDWYPTMRLWRQSARGDWGPVIGSVKEALTRAASIPDL